ncbi:MAG: hypothetical protein IKK97_00325 [Phascolarctobacterium sp.]|nr:hypothetical protein [Phascolarctobacterium sp.]
MGYEEILAEAHRQLEEAEVKSTQAKADLFAARNTQKLTLRWLRILKTTVKWMWIVTGINAVICVIAYFYIKSLLEG